ncbi:tetratricopeptide repeat protein [bacterium]|nr:tetratricopeptide repeat protein [bacterium]
MNEWVVFYLIWKIILVIVGIPQENYYNFGNQLYSLGDYAQAEKFYNQSASELKLAHRAYYNAGNAAFLQGNYLDAIEYYEASLDVVSDDEDAWFNLELARRKALKNKKKPNLELKKSTPRRPPNKKQQSGAAALKPNKGKQPETIADQVLARARRREEVLYRFQNTNVYQRHTPKQTKDIFTQTPEEILKTMREMTKAGYPFRPGASLRKPKLITDEIDW